jgi:predicted dehydrogenase
VIAADIVMMQCGGLIMPADNWRFVPQWNPGGPLFQIGVHELDLLRWWLGEGKVIGAIERTGISGKATPDAMTLLMRFGKVAATVHSHYVCAYRHFAQIFGTEGNLYYSIQPEELYFQPQRAGTEEPMERVELTPVEGEAGAMKRFGDALRSGRPYTPNGQDGLAMMQMVDDAVRLAREMS